MKLIFRGGVIDSPDFGAKFEVGIAQFFATIADFDKGMEEAENRRDRREER